MPSELKVIALRLDADTLAEVEALAAADMRSVAQMAAIFLKSGLRQYKANGNRWQVDTGLDASAAKRTAVRLKRR